jgi:hypothetical protein
VTRHGVSDVMRHGVPVIGKTFDFLMTATPWCDTQDPEGPEVDVVRGRHIHARHKARGRAPMSGSAASLQAQNTALRLSSKPLLLRAGPQRSGAIAPLVSLLGASAKGTLSPPLRSSRPSPLPKPGAERAAYPTALE